MCNMSVSEVDADMAKLLTISAAYCAVVFGLEAMLSSDCSNVATVLMERRRMQASCISLIGVTLW